MGEAARTYRVKAGIDWAIENGARVINMSFRTANTPEVNDALNAATAANIVLVAGSGNGEDNNNVGRPIVAFPASRPDVIAVGSINNRGHRAVSSDHGPNLDVVAPGVNIFTTGMLGDSNIVNDGGSGVYAFRSGTSHAAPHVAGIAALMLSVNNPTLITAQQVRDIIKRTANRDRNVLQGFTFSTVWGRPAPWNRYVGHGLVNAYAAVREAMGFRPTISGPAAVCAGAIATFSIPPLSSGVTVRWRVEASLIIVGGNNQNTVMVRHSGATTPANSRVIAEIYVNNVHWYRVVHDVVVNRPTITSITQVNLGGQVIPGTTVHTGNSLLFRVNHNSPGANVTWSVSPNQSVPISFWDANTLNVGFTFPGGYMITATVANACGTHTMTKNITAVRPPTIQPPIGTCIYCGTPYTDLPGCPRCPVTRPPDLLREPDDPIEEKEQTN